MNAFFKNALSVGLALVFLLGAANASGFFYSFAANNAFLSVCRGAGCLVPLLPYSGVIYSGYVQNHRLNYLYSYPKYNIYGELVDGFYSAKNFYNYNYTYPYFSAPAKIYPPADVRNSQAKADEAMEEALPTIQPSTPESVVRQLLNFNAAVLVVEKGRIAGIITKSNLLEQMLK